MAGAGARDTLPRLGHVEATREAWLVRADGALAHRLQDREVEERLCDNRHRNRVIRQDFPLALSEQRGIDSEARRRERERRRQAADDAGLALGLAGVRLAEPRRRPPPRDPVPEPEPESPGGSVDADAFPEPDAEALGLSRAELAEMRRRLEQEERDARLARELSRRAAAEGERDALLADVRCAVEAQDGELARLLQEREYKKLQKAKEKARQRALLRKQQRSATRPAESNQTPSEPELQNPSCLLDAYSNPRDVLREAKNGHWSSKSVDSDLNYIEPFEKEHIQSKASALLSKNVSQQWYLDQPDRALPLPARNADRQISTDSTNNNVRGYGHSSSRHSIDSVDDRSRPPVSMQHRQHRPPPVPTCSKKPRFPDPVSIRAASRYPSDDALSEDPLPPESYHNNNTYGSSFPTQYNALDSPPCGSGDRDLRGPSERTSVASDAAHSDSKRRKTTEGNEKKKSCSIQ